MTDSEDMDEPTLPEGVEPALDEAFAKVAGLTGFTPIETARLFISYAVACMEAFSTADGVLDELDGAIDFITGTKARVKGVKH